jgi:hypothetical protein
MFDAFTTFAAGLGMIIIKSIQYALGVLLGITCGPLFSIWIVGLHVQGRKPQLWPDFQYLAATMGTVMHVYTSLMLYGLCFSR